MLLSDLLKEHLNQRVKITLVTGAVFEGYLVGLKLPIVELIILKFVPDRHIQKYVKHFNNRWVDIIPFEFIKKVEPLKGDEEIIITLHCVMELRD